MKNTIYWHRFLERFVEEFKKIKYLPSYFGQFEHNGKTYRIKLIVSEGII